MEVSVTDNGALGRRLHIVIPHAEVHPEFEKAVRDMSKKVRLDGFRPGKVPLQVVEQRYGEQIFRDVAQDAIRNSYIKAVTDQRLEPAGQPQFEDVTIARGQDISFDANIEIYPEFEIADLSATEIEKPLAEITEEDRATMLEKVRKNHMRWNAVDREAKEGDRLTFDIESLDATDDAAKSEDLQMVLGEESQSANFASQLLGVRAAEQREVKVEVTAPEAGHKEYKVSVKRVEEGELPALDQEFFKACGVEDGGLEALRKLISEGMESQLAESIARLTKEHVMTALLSNNTPEIPQSLIDAEAQSMKQTTARNSGLDDKATEQLSDEMFQGPARKRVTLGLLLKQFSKQHQITVGEQAFETKLTSLVANYENQEAAKEHYRKDREARFTVEALALEDLIVARVQALARSVEKQYSFDEIVEKAHQSGA